MAHMPATGVSGWISTCVMGMLEMVGDTFSKWANERIRPCIGT